MITAMVMMLFMSGGYIYIPGQVANALYRPDLDSNDCELPSGQATPSILAAYHPIAAQCSGVKDTLYFHYSPCLAWFPACSRSNAVTAWFTSLMLSLLGSPL